MAHVVILLDPARLNNPDADLRYLLPDALVARAPKLLKDDAYDYDEHNRMLVYLKTRDLRRGAQTVIDELHHLSLLGNRFRRAAVIAVSRGSRGAGRAPARCQVVWPPRVTGTLADLPPGRRAVRK